MLLFCLNIPFNTLINKYYNQLTKTTARFLIQIFDFGYLYQACFLYINAWQKSHLMQWIFFNTDGFIEIE